MNQPPNNSKHDAQSKSPRPPLTHEEWLKRPATLELLRRQSDAIARQFPNREGPSVLADGVAKGLGRDKASKEKGIGPLVYENTAHANAVGNLDMKRAAIDRARREQRFAKVLRKHAEDRKIVEGSTESQFYEEAIDTLMFETVHTFLDEQDLDDQHELAIWCILEKLAGGNDEHLASDKTIADHCRLTPARVRGLRERLTKALQDELEK